MPSVSPGLVLSLFLSDKRTDTHCPLGSSRLCSRLCVLWYQGRKLLQVASGPPQWRLIEPRVKVEGDLLLGQSCVDAICHHRLEHVNADPPPAPPPESHRWSWRGRQTVRALTQLPYSLLYWLLSPPANYNPLFSPPSMPLKHMSTTQFTQCTRQWALVQRTVAKEPKRWQIETNKDEIREKEWKERVEDWNGYSGWNLGVRVQWEESAKQKIKERQW